MTPQLFLLLCLPAVYESALPPGYQDRLFCPDKYCLGRKHPGAGMVGPKTLFWEVAGSWRFHIISEMDMWEETRAEQQLRNPFSKA